jgi:hypothetical protein
MIVSYIKESYNNWGSLNWVFKCIKIASKVDSFTIKSVNIIFDRKDDWNMNENIDQSKVAIVAVLSQLRESANHIWSDNVYVDIQLFSKNKLKDLILFRHLPVNKK